jgi:nucleoside-diphosphate-sugar epimerase
MSTRTVLVTGVSGVAGSAIAVQLHDEYVVGQTHQDHDVTGVEETVLPNGRDTDVLRLGLRYWAGSAPRTFGVAHRGCPDVTAGTGTAAEVFSKRSSTTHGGLT